jgi:hypothetical protein
MIRRRLLRRVGTGCAGALRAWRANRQALYPAGAIGLNVTGNHDSNSGRGSDDAQFAFTRTAAGRRLHVEVELTAPWSWKVIPT